MSATTEPSPFAYQLRRWRSLRRISQLDLATSAGTSQRHLSFLEQGRSRPGRTMVVRLAESLELSPRERNGLLTAAGFAPLFPESSLDGPDLRSVRSALALILDGHMPYPAMVVRSGGELVVANGAIALLTEGAAARAARTPDQRAAACAAPRRPGVPRGEPG